MASRSSRQRAEWVKEGDALVEQATRIGNAQTQTLVRDVVDILDSLGAAPAGADFSPQPFGGKAQVIVPSLLSFEPTQGANSEASRRLEQALTRSPVAFGALSF